MKVLFVNPFFFVNSALERRFKTFYFPLGLLYLAAAARACPPTENVELVRRRWEQALLLKGERLEEP